MRDFPNVTPEPTSALPSLADSEMYSKITHGTCPNCESDSIRVSKSGVSTHFCRTCETGANALRGHKQYGDDWNDVRMWVLERDGHECVECGSRDSLHVHHIARLVYFETTADAHSPDNLETLCRDCHFENHRRS